MEHEQRDSYLIPPNFIEGGTLMGGMFRTRNVIEAGVLGAAVGLPVLNLGFSLTTRIIILCLTALPLVLLALIGVGGAVCHRSFCCFSAICETAEYCPRTLRRGGGTARSCPCSLPGCRVSDPQRNKRPKHSPKAKAAFRWI